MSLILTLLCQSSEVPPQCLAACLWQKEIFVCSYVVCSGHVCAALLDQNSLTVLFLTPIKASGASMFANTNQHLII